MEATGRTANFPGNSIPQVMTTESSSVRILLNFITYLWEHAIINFQNIGLALWIAQIARYYQYSSILRGEKASKYFK